ncbi:hypothetical protein LCM20_09435 [Halobacillus litoralis]|uniref:hypothetical protein n=1 Tax=Halobacillus litoralis TaxID=45668 RepID=UPI001CD6253C|nr:hypothetical protein [Halobacillus litoralis]MCA0970811.1 hypothetical protein [Halobacillus litoralis]
MLKRKRIFIIPALAIAYFAYLWFIQVNEGAFIQGEITEINQQNAEMDININVWSSVNDDDTHGFIRKYDSQTIRVANPNDYEEGQRVQVEVTKGYEEDVWDLDRLEFDVKKIEE